MNNNSFSDSLKSLHEKNDIPSLYDTIMNGYPKESTDFPLVGAEDGYYQKLYAPGYEENGVAEVVATCI